MFPIQATCSIDENEIRSTVSKLVNQFVTNQKNELAQPLKVRFISHTSSRLLVYDVFVCGGWYVHEEKEEWVIGLHKNW